ncbi:MAG: neutral/alkaline ceramidase [Myxococcales bacterium]|jgi:neutral ceramidase
MSRSVRLLSWLMIAFAALTQACAGERPAPPDVPDAAVADAATSEDAGRSDAGEQPDAASYDAGEDGGADAGVDAGIEDAGDAGPLDPCEDNRLFEIGAGIHDITGPAAELGMMGYSMVGQKTAGIHTRLWSRAFVIRSPCNGESVVFVSADLLAVFQAVQQQVIERLQATHGTTYSERNVFLSATHTHAGPGGYSHYTTYDLSILGFNKQNFDAIVEGIHLSIVKAHQNLAPGRIRVASGELLDTSINRSLEAYRLNPEDERALYEHDTDKEMTVLRFEERDGAELGMVSFYGVHATSMGNDNHLISGDNKGYASYFFEKAKGTDYRAQRTFVAAFAQAASGDASPNIYGGTEGGGPDDFASTASSGRKQLNKALELYDAAHESLVGPVDLRHLFAKMDDIDVRPELSDGEPHATCSAAYGVSMIAGAEDGPGYGKEGASCETLGDLWAGLTCTPETTACQAEKPIIFKAGEQRPFPWSPEVLPFQIVRIGNLALVGLPFEVTTMASRRLRQTALAHLAEAGIDRLIVVGPVNAYASYLTTREEYAAQNYEGASTHFGPWTLAAAQQQIATLAEALASGAEIAPGPIPRDLRDHVHTLQIPVLYDDKLLSVDFGDVVEDVARSYRRGETARAVFWGAHPANNLRIGDTFLRVERKQGESWETVANDWDWETKFRWKRNNCFPTLGCSHVTVEWDIPDDAAPGIYRLRCFGDWKSVGGDIQPYEGTSSEFEVW